MSFTTSIPVPKNDVDSLYKTTMALKQAVEQILGQRGSERMPTIYVQSTQPEIDDEGNFWLQSGIKTTLSVSVGGKWIPVGTLT